MAKFFTIAVLLLLSITLSLQSKVEVLETDNHSRLVTETIYQQFTAFNQFLNIDESSLTFDVIRTLVKSAISNFESKFMNFSTSTCLVHLLTGENDQEYIEMTIDENGNLQEKLLQSDTWYVLDKTAQNCKVSLTYSANKTLTINNVEVLPYIDAALKAYQRSEWEDLRTLIHDGVNAVLYPDNQPLNNELFLKFLEARAPFDVKLPQKFQNLTIGDVKALYANSEIVNPDAYNVPRVSYKDSDLAANIPVNWSAWNVWPNCEHAILNQGDCGSCWAFGSAEAITDRFCIASNASTNIIFSPQYLVSCNDGDEMGCNGGVPLFAWWFMEYNGIVPLSCLAYTSGENGTTGSCPATCNDGSPYQFYKAQALSTKTYSDPQSIQVDMLQNGPITTSFLVYQDFMSYSGGIYKHTTGDYVGGHCVKIVGWGNENNTNYWYIANSWGADWGLDGYFKIEWNDCGINDLAVAGIPAL
jgi:cathepsin B